MSNELIPFSNDDFDVRVILIDGEPWWLAKDVCDALGVRTNDLLNGLDDDEKGYDIVVSPGGPQRYAIINEAGLYSAILRSRKEQAKVFKRWITHEVLPAIRKTGSYSTAPALPQDYASALRALADSVEARELAEAKVEELEPKGEFYDDLMTAEGTYSMQVASNIIRWRGRGRTTFMAELRRQKILQHDNVPYSNHMRHFKVIPRTRELPDGSKLVYSATEVRPTGLPWLRQRLADHARY